MEGLIVKGIGGFYYVKTSTGIIECKARGIFRHKDLTPMIGDNVIITEDDSPIISDILPRKNKLIRPPVANITQAYIIFSIKNPEMNIDLLNRFLITCEYFNIKAIVCINKIDLGSDSNQIEDMLKKTNYKVIYIAAKEGIGLDYIKNNLKGNLSVFSGPSGVGKSTLLNKIVGNELMETGELSKKIKRGKNTTRHCEIIEVGQGFLVDTPGFSSIDCEFIKKEDLENLFPEFDNYKSQCKFNNCSHNKEVGCSIKEALSNGEIDKTRYEFYIKVLEEINSRRKWK
ncbi:MAG: ribosome small subunit-dependent GTPase A [Clostridiaceae bacterium]